MPHFTAPLFVIGLPNLNSPRFFRAFLLFLNRVNDPLTCRQLFVLG